MHRSRHTRKSLHHAPVAAANVMVLDIHFWPTALSSYRTRPWGVTRSRVRNGAFTAGTRSDPDLLPL